MKEQYNVLFNIITIISLSVSLSVSFEVKEIFKFNFSCYWEKAKSSILYWDRKLTDCYKALLETPSYILNKYLFIKAALMSVFIFFLCEIAAYLFNLDWTQIMWSVCHTSPCEWAVTRTITEDYFRLSELLL